MKISHLTDVPPNRRRFWTQGIALGAIAGLDPLAGMLHGATTITTGKTVELLPIAGTRRNSIRLAERKVAQQSAPVYMYFFAWKSPTFARNGQPDHKGIPNWPQYDFQKRAVVIFDTTCRIVNDPDSKVRAMGGNLAVPMERRSRNAA
jgi:hypothetical protein